MTTKRKDDIFDTEWPWYPLDSRENLLKWNLFEITKLVLFARAIRKKLACWNTILELWSCLRNKNRPGKKPEFKCIISLRYISYSIWDSSCDQTGRTSGQGKKRQRDILNFKWKTMRSLCLNLSVSQCVSLLLDNMRLICKWALFKSRFTWTEKYSILNI